MKSEKRFLIGNWKMNPASLEEAEPLFFSIEKEVQKIRSVEIIICPPFIYLSKFRKGGLKLGAQNCSWEEKGSCTGEISPLMLKNMGCEYVILGHSERRKCLGETNDMILNKVNAALKVGLKPIICIGETAAEREEKKTGQILAKQLNILSEIQMPPPEGLIVAYEPVWAIGTGNSCPLSEAGNSLQAIREISGEKRPILYGGSVNSNNAEDFINIGFSGLLVGAKSLYSKEFIEIAKKLEV